MQLAHTGIKLATLALSAPTEVGRCNHCVGEPWETYPVILRRDEKAEALIYSVSQPDFFLTSIWNSYLALPPKGAQGGKHQNIKTMQFTSFQGSLLNCYSVVWWLECQVRIWEIKVPTWPLRSKQSSLGNGAPKRKDTYPGLEAHSALITARMKRTTARRQLTLLISYPLLGLFSPTPPV